MTAFVTIPHFPFPVRMLRWLMALVAPDTARSRDERTFTDTIGLHADVINRICRSFARNGNDFDDLRQDVLINIWKGIREFRADANIRTWIYRVTLNTCVSTYRRRRHTQGIEEVAKASGMVSESEIRDYEYMQWVNVLFSQLSATDHAIIVMWLDELSYEEIATVMGMNRNTVATRVRRTRQRLQQIISSKNN